MIEAKKQLDNNLETSHNYINKYKSLKDYFIFISNNYNLQISIYDYTGFISTDSKLTTALRPFHIHGNDYCMYVKSSRQLWDRCLAKKNCIAEKCRKEKGTFYGTCHAGVEEYIIPVFHHHKLISFISAGVFRSNQQLAKRLMSRISRDYDLNLDLLNNYYQEALSTRIPDYNLITDLLNIASVYISQIYDGLQRTNPDLLQKKKYNSTEDYILHHVLDYIDRNFRKDFTVSDIANFCHCSESYINHLFKKKMQDNIRAYINQLRIKEAKIQLSNSDLLIKHIATNVGYNDPNYFSRVFTESCGYSPTEYRKKIRICSWK